MIQRIKKLLSHSATKNFSIYAIGTIVFKSSNIILMPVILHIFSSAEFGQLALAHNFITVLTLLMGLGLHQLVNLEFFHLTIPERKQLINNVIVIFSAFALPVLIVMLCSLNWFNNLVFIGQATNLTLVIALLTCFVSFFTELFFHILRYTQKAIHLVIVQLTSAALALILKLYFLYQTPLRVDGILLANFASLIAICIHAYHQYKQKKLPFSLAILKNKKAIGRYLTTSIPLAPTMLFSWIMAITNRWILAHYTSMQAVGLYSFADLFAQVYQLVIMLPLMGAYFPYIIGQFVAHQDNPQAVEQSNRTLMWASVTLMIVAIPIGLWILKPIIFMFISSEYQHAYQYILPLLWGQAFWMGGYLATCYIQFKKNVPVLFGLMAITVICNLFFTLLLVPRMQVMGSVIALCLSYLLYFILSMRANRSLIQKNSLRLTTL